MTKISSSLLAALLLGPLKAMALDSGLYFDVNVGQSNTKDVSKSSWDAGLDDSLSGSGVSRESSTFKTKSPSWSAAVGYQIFPYLSADLGWMDLGKIKYHAELTTGGENAQYDAYVSTAGPTAAVNGTLPITKRFAAHARAGMIFNKISSHVKISDSLGLIAEGGGSEKSRDFFVGTSASINITETIAAYLGWQRVINAGDKATTGEINIDVISLGFTFKQ